MTLDLITQNDYRTMALSLMAPPSGTSAWDWCSAHLHLRHGRWDPRRAGLMRHWYELVTARVTGQPLEHDPYAHRMEECYLVMIAQIAKTTIMQSMVAWIMAQYPQEMAWYNTRLKDQRRFRETRMEPMIRNTPALASLLPTSVEGQERAIANDLVSLGGSLVHLLNGNLLDDVRSLALPKIFCDEFDRLVEDLDEQGDPIDLMLVRQRTFPHEKLFMGGSTPGAVNGHAWRRLRTGSHERPLVVCPTCGAADFLNDTQVVGAHGALADYPATVIINERLARWTCQYCDAQHGANTVRSMVLDCIQAGGRWTPGTWAQDDDHPSGHWKPSADFDSAHRLIRIHPPETVIRSGWANALYSENVTLDTFAAGMVQKLFHGKPSEKKTWTNTEGCRPWIHTFIPTTADEIIDASAADYALGTCPVKADWLILTLDQQGNHAGKYWYPYVVRAHTNGGESWLVAVGKAESQQSMEDLEERLFSIGGEMRTVDVIAMDIANPNFRKDGYRWASQNPRRRLCLRGDVRLRPGETWKEVQAPDPKHQSRTDRPSNVHEWRIHPHHWRTELEQAMLGKSAFPWHIPSSDAIPDFYLRSLNAEDQTIETQRVTGEGFQEVVVWKPRVTSQTDDTINVRKDIHWADCEKMQLALADILGITKASTTPDRPIESREDAETPEKEQFGGGVW